MKINNEYHIIVPRYAKKDIRFTNGRQVYGVIDNLYDTLIGMFDTEMLADRYINDVTLDSKANGEPVLVHVINNRHDKLIARCPVTDKGVD